MGYQMMLHHHMYLPRDPGMQPHLQHMLHLQPGTMDGYLPRMHSLTFHPVSMAVKVTSKSANTVKPLGGQKW
jgi:hypothetical protein